MTLTGIDLAWSRPTIDQIKQTGAHWVARYFSNDDSKDLHASEVTSYPAAGLAIVTVWETTTGRARAGRAAGIADAQNADAQRKAVGLPAGMPIHFAVDEDTTWAAVAPYMAGAASVLGQARVGVYGSFQVIEGAYAAGYRYLWQTLAWSYGKWSAHATIRQTGGTTLGGAADWDTAMVADFGQYPRPVTPQEIDMDATQARQLAELHDAMVPAKGWDYSHGDHPDVHQTLTTAADQATTAATNTKALLAKAGAVTLTDAQVAQVAAALAKDPALAGNIAELVAEKLAARLQN